MGWSRFISILGILGIAASAAAQSASPLSSRPLAGGAHAVMAESPAQQLAALQAWTRDYAAWKAWFAQWRSRPEPGYFSTHPRHVQPAPPAWLAEMCDGRSLDVGPLTEACRAFDDWRAGDPATELVTQQLAQARSRQEAPGKTLWWERIHADALWPMTQTGSSTLGVAGMHATAHLTKRLQVFLAPGVIMMRLPAIQGGMTWSAATDWGFSLRLFDFRMPAANRASTIHFNMVRVWALGAPSLQAAGEMYLAGFSLTFKRK
jgi:hypothetical protein